MDFGKGYINNGQKLPQQKTHRFYFVAANGKRKSYVLTFGDEVNIRNGVAPSGSKYKRVEHRGRLGEWKPPTVTASVAWKCISLM